jgi:hypothetical protein
MSRTSCRASLLGLVGGSDVTHLAELGDSDEDSELPASGVREDNRGARCNELGKFIPTRLIREEPLGVAGSFQVDTPGEQQAGQARRKAVAFRKQLQADL